MARTVPWHHFPPRCVGMSRTFSSLAIFLCSVIGLDFTGQMLALACQKQSRVDSPPRFVCGDALRLPIGPAQADVISIAFGIRNVAEPRIAIREFFRVLRPGGRAVILEFSFPRSPLLRSLYRLYFRHVMPRTAAFIAGDRTGAYKYLPRSVETFLDRAQIMSLLHQAGFVHTTFTVLTFGIAVVYRGIKPTVV